MVALLAIALLAQAALPSAPSPALPPMPGPALPHASSPALPQSFIFGDDQLRPLDPKISALDAELRRYFAGEQDEAWFWLGAGLAAAGAGTGLMAASSDVAHGASFPLFDISVVQFGAAAWLLWRTHDQVERLSTQLQREPCRFFAEEPERMRKVTRGFRIYLPIEATTLVGGAAMMGFGYAHQHDFLAGAGIGLVAQSVVMLIFDQFAAARAESYERDLHEAAPAFAGECARPRG